MKVRIVRHACIACLALLCAATGTYGDSIVVRRVKYDRLTIVGLSGGFLVCRIPPHNATIRKKLADITRIYLTDDRIFNQAEA